MAKTIALALLLVGAASADGAPDLMNSPALTPGRYALSIQGMICTVCARAVAAEFAGLPDVQKIAVDYEKGRAVFTVQLNGSLKILALRKALRRAEKTANLDARFELHAIDSIP